MLGPALVIAGIVLTIIGAQPGPPELGSGVLATGISCLIVGVAWTAGFAVYIIHANRVASEERATRRAAPQLHAAAGDATAAPFQADHDDGPQAAAAGAHIVIVDRDAAVRVLGGQHSLAGGGRLGDGGNAGAASPRQPTAAAPTTRTPSSSESVQAPLLP